MGKNKETAIIDGEESYHIIQVLADGTKLSDFTIVNGSGKNYAAAIYINANHTIVKSNNVKPNLDSRPKTHTIYVEYCDYNTIQDNFIGKSYSAVQLYHANYTTVKSNVIDGENFQTGNGCLFGIYIIRSNNNEIFKNTLSKFTHSSQGIGIHLQYTCNNNKIHANTLEYIGKKAIGFSNLDGTEVNKIYHNNFIRNKLDVDYGFNNVIFDNGYSSGGNYWDKYRGTDKYHSPNQDKPIKDGIGDSFYDMPNSGIDDNYPLMKKYGQSKSKEKGIISIFDFFPSLNYLIKFLEKY